MSASDFIPSRVIGNPEDPWWHAHLWRWVSTPEPEFTPYGERLPFILDQPDPLPAFLVPVTPDDLRDGSCLPLLWEGTYNPNPLVNLPGGRVSPLALAWTWLHPRIEAPDRITHTRLICRGDTTKHGGTGVFYRAGDHPLRCINPWCLRPERDLTLAREITATWLEDNDYPKAIALESYLKEIKPLLYRPDPHLWRLCYDLLTNLSALLDGYRSFKEAPLGGDYGMFSAMMEADWRPEPPPQPKKSREDRQSEYWRAEAKRLHALLPPDDEDDE